MIYILLSTELPSELKKKYYYCVYFIRSSFHKEKYLERQL